MSAIISIERSIIAATPFNLNSQEQPATNRLYSHTCEDSNRDIASTQRRQKTIIVDPEDDDDDSETPVDQTHPNPYPVSSSDYLLTLVKTSTLLSTSRLSPLIS